MTRRKRYAPVPTLVSLHAVALAVGKKPGQTLLLLQRTGLYGRYARLGVGRRVAFDQRVIDVLHAVLGQAHRPLEKPEHDWLSQWLQRGGETSA